MLRPDTLRADRAARAADRARAGRGRHVSAVVPRDRAAARRLARDGAAHALALPRRLTRSDRSIYGPLSDRYGRIPVLRFALAVYCVASLACALAPNIELLLTARAVQALGSSGAIVLARAIVRDLYSGARAGREFSLMGAIMALAPVGAPMIGGVLQSAFGWRSHFVLQIAFGLIAAFFVWRKLPETLRARTPGPFSLRAILAGYAEIMRNRAVLAYVGMLAAELRGRVRVDLRLVLRAAGNLRPLRARVRARLRGGERRLSCRHRARDPHRDRASGSIAPSASARSRSRSAASARSRRSRSAARRPFRSSPRWRCTRSAWGWCSRRPSRAR